MMFASTRRLAPALSSERARYPMTLGAWRSFLQRALQRPLQQVPFPPHFVIQTVGAGGRAYSPHKPTVMTASEKGGESAVMLLLAPYSEEGKEESFRDLTLLVTKRSFALRHHKGEVSFPGGHLNVGESAVSAAIRETAEETGITVRPEWVVGELTTIPSSRRRSVTPVVAVSPTPLQPHLTSPDEVLSFHYLHPMSNLVLRSSQSHARVLKRRSLAFDFPSYFPCFFASLSPSVITPAVVPSTPPPAAANVDAGLSPLLPKDFPGELVWGLTALILCELISRLATELDGAACLMESNVVAMDPLG